VRFFLHFFLLGFHDPRSQRRDLILTQLRILLSARPGSTGIFRIRQFHWRRLVPRWIIPVRGKRAVIRHADIFFRGHWSRFGFCARIGK
jgi:hypothetical protein